MTTGLDGLGIYRSPHRGIFYGWFVVLGAFVLMTAAFGCAYSFTTFFDSLQSEFGATRAETSLIFSIATAGFFGLGMLSGPLSDSVGPRVVTGFGVVVIAAGLCLAAFSGTLWQIFLAIGLGLGIGVGFVYVPAVAAVQPWFEKRRGIASGLAVSGIGVGTLVVPPVAAWLIEWGGWRVTYLALAGAALVVGLLAALLMENRPDRRGLPPDTARPLPPPRRAADDGDGEEPARAAPALPPVDLTVRQAVRTSPYWFMYLAAFLLSVGLFIPYVHIVPAVQDMGFDKAVGVQVLQMIAIGSIAGRFLVGFVADFVGRRVGYAGTYIATGLSFLVWLFAKDPWQLYVFALMFGTGYGAFVALSPAMAADYFGGRRISSILGWLYSSVTFAVLLGPPLAGLAYDILTSYKLPLIAAAVASGFGAVMILLLPDPATWRAAWREAATSPAPASPGAAPPVPEPAPLALPALPPPHAAADDPPTDQPPPDDMPADGLRRGRFRS